MKYLNMLYSSYNYNYNDFIINNSKLLLISGSLVISIVGFLYFKGYLFNSIINDNDKDINNNDVIVSVSDSIYVSSSNKVDSEGSDTIISNKSLATITSLDTVMRYNNINIDSVMSNYETAKDELNNSNVEISELEYKDIGIQTYTNVRYKDVGINTLIEGEKLELYNKLEELISLYNNYLRG